MKKNDWFVSRIILRKSNSHLKIAIGMFLAVSFFIVTTGMVYIQQYYGLNKNFFDNKAVHTINVSSYVEEGEILSLESSDCKKILEILSNEFPEENFDIIPVYATCTGVVDSNGDMYKVYGIPKESFSIVGDISVETDTLYLITGDEGDRTFEVSNYEITSDGGMISSKSVDKELKCKMGVSTTSPILIFNNIQEGVFHHGFVEQETFLELAQTISCENGAEVDSLCGNGLVEMFGIFVDVEDLTRVEDVSKKLGEYGYSSMCTFDAFDGFGDYFGTTMWIVLAFACLVLIVSILLLFFAFNSYYRIQQKDMGILKYYGFNEKRITNIYLNGLRTFFSVNAIILLIYSVILGCYLNILSHWLMLSAFMLLVCIILGVIYWMIKNCVIKKYIQKDILFLLKKSKETE